MAHKRGLSINSLLLFSFALIAVLPVSLLGFKIYDAAWDNAWREVHEKHQLLAENLAQPISIYIKGHKTTLAITGNLIRDLNFPAASSIDAVNYVLDESLTLSDGLCGIFLLDRDKQITAYKSEYRIEKDVENSIFESMEFVDTAILNKKATVSPVLINPLNGEPAIYIAQPLLSQQNPNTVHHILVGELKISPIEKLRQGIRFGEAGHSAIVDKLGHVIAHPNPDWMAPKIKDLSNLNIVKKMMAGQTGVTEFYSPFVKQTMIAGYTAVPELGWGIMVPQPKAELAEQVRNIVFTQFSWGLLGLVVALITAHFLGRWITQPINELASAGNRLSKEGFQDNLPKIRDSAPYELQLLAGCFNAAIHGLSASRAEVEDLNRSLQSKIKDATNELREANMKLSVLARSDHLTNLANRRHFEQTIVNLASRRQEDTDNVCLLLVDVDHFKQINDRYGHSAGDMVLIQIAEVLEHHMRQTDLAARYAGDEFIVLIRANEDIGRERADTIRDEIAKQKFHLDGEDFEVTVSVGLFIFNIAEYEHNMEKIFRNVDTAMYKAKEQGRNTVEEFRV
ncbi:MAG: diguanylate cyclase [Gammaproteobacteria bacterium]|nr:diguanylate cyclase [Gammaproteobacteria bacterium]